jgi:hypothetical protein
MTPLPRCFTNDRSTNEDGPTHIRRHSMLSRLARLCCPDNIWMFAGSFDEPPFE